MFVYIEPPGGVHMVCCSRLVGGTNSHTRVVNYNTYTERDVCGTSMYDEASGGGGSVQL